MSLTIINSNNIFQKGVIGNVRKAQEDSHDIAMHTPNGDVFVVCDGMGGHVGGKQASSLAVKCILEYLKKERYLNPLEAISDALQFANLQILACVSEYPELKGMGTTACILLLRDDEAYIAHVGDSRIYLYLGKEKQLHRITKDHSFVQTLLDAEKITEEEAETHPNKNRILKALGIKPELQPTVNYQNKPILPKNGDVFLICSDGLNGMISDNTIQNILSQNTSIEQRGEMLISLALQGENGQLGGQDNITVELIQIENSPWKKSEFKSFNPSSKTKIQSSAPTSAKLKILFLAVLVALLSLVGVVTVYSFIQKRIKKEKIELLRINRDNANREYLNLIQLVADKQLKHDEVAKETETAKKFFDDNKNNKDAEKAYNGQKLAYDKSAEILQDIKKQRDKAQKKADSLRDSFESDSISIVKSLK